MSNFVMVNKGIEILRHSKSGSAENAHTEEVKTLDINQIKRRLHEEGMIHDVEQIGDWLWSKGSDYGTTKDRVFRSLGFKFHSYRHLWYNSLGNKSKSSKKDISIIKKYYGTKDLEENKGIASPKVKGLAGTRKSNSPVKRLFG